MFSGDVTALFFSAGLSLAAGALLGPLIIRMLYRLKFGQSIRSEGPQTHLKKAGTPTMGGILIWSALLISMAVQRLIDRTLVWFVLIILGHALLGFLDDYIKAVRKDPEGLSARWKLVGQFILALIFYLALLIDGPSSIRIPLFNWQLPLGLLYPVFAILYMMFFSNAVNFADGIDGLNGGLTFIFSLFCMLIALRQEQWNLAYFAAALAGAIASFLIFNLHPAKLFMGDTGSLGLGAALAGMALLLRQEAVLLLAGVIFLAEMFSVIIQVLYFKKTGGKRFFRMAPIHHHFELLGWSEWRIVFSFWGVALLATCLAYLLI